MYNKCIKHGNGLKTNQGSMCGEDRGMGLGNSGERFSYISKNVFLNCIMGTQVLQYSQIFLCHYFVT